MTNTIEIRKITTRHTPVSELSQSYYEDAKRLETHISKLKDQIKSLPDPDTLTDLESRLYILKEERRDLLCSAAHLARLAAPPPPHPSLRFRERELS